MKLTALLGGVVTDYEVWPEAAVLLEDGRIRDVLPDGSLVEEAHEIYDYGDSFLVPGFVDLQVNGGYGVDVASEPGRVPELSRSLLETGTTAYLPTVISCSEEFYGGALPEIATAAGDSSGAEVLGIHLEGPFINPGKHGAHETARIVDPDTELMERLLSLGPVRMVTLAPELVGAGGLVELAAGRGVVVSAGHSDAFFETAYKALDRGVSSLTHLFNAMGPMHHRQPGLPGAAFAHPRVVCGLIPDGLHVHPEMVNLAFRMLGPDRIYLVTDSTAATGMEPGEYSLTTQKIYHDANMARLGSGALAGSLLTMSEAFQNILAFTGCTVAEAARMASTTPAKLVGEGRRKGRLAPGYDADVTVLAPNLSVEAVWKNGQRDYSRERIER